MSGCGAEPAPAAPRPRAGWRIHALAWSVLLTVCAALFAATFERWGHPIIDIGRDLLIASQLLEGRVLYREVLYNYGPVAPYVLASVVAVAGDNLAVFETLGIALGFATMLGLYAVGLQLQGVATGFATALGFALLCFFANTTWGCNFVLPHAYAATLGIALAVSSFALLLRHIGRGRTRDLVFAAGLAVLALATKVEVGVASVGVIALAAWAHRLAWRPLAAVVAVTAVLGGLGALVFRGQAPGDHALLAENLTKFGGSVLFDPFFLRVAGIDHPLRNLAIQVSGLAGMVLLVGCAAVAGRLLEARRTRRPGAALLGAAGAAGLLLGIPLLADVRLLGASVLVAPVVAVVCTTRDRRDPLLLLAAFVLFTAPRILLQYHPYWYGYTLSVPALPFAVYGLGVRLPPLTPSPRLTVIALALLALLAVYRFEASVLPSQRAMTAVLETPKGDMRDLPVGRSEAIEQLLAHVDAMPDARARSLVAFPEGVTLNYFTGLENPTAYHLFTPPEIADAQVEARVLAELRRRPPDLVVLVPRDLTEYGSEGFGRDYAREIRRWIQRHYRRTQVFRGAGDRWPLQLWERRGPGG